MTSINKEYTCNTCTNHNDCNEVCSDAVRDVSRRCGLQCHSDAVRREDLVKILEVFRARRRELMVKKKKDHATLALETELQWVILKIEEL